MGSSFVHSPYNWTRFLWFNFLMTLAWARSSLFASMAPVLTTTGCIEFHCPSYTSPKYHIALLHSNVTFCLSISHIASSEMDNCWENGSIQSKMAFQCVIFLTSSPVCNDILFSSAVSDTMLASFTDNRSLLRLNSTYTHTNTIQ